jgi:hypothetical protein
MADDIAVTPGTGATVRTKDRAGVETQVVIIDKSGGATENVGLTGSKTSSDPAPTSTATLVLAANAGRKACIIQNVGTVNCYLGATSGVTTSNGLLLRAGEELADDTSVDDWYGITASGTADLRVVEVA